MKKMPFKNDLEMWHKFAEFAHWMKFVAIAEEHKMISQCKFYSYDDGAFEEYCHCPSIKRTIDFTAEEECWKCKHYSMEKEKTKPKFIASGQHATYLRRERDASTQTTFV